MTILNHCRPAGDPGEESGAPFPSGARSQQHRDLPYRVELWDAAKTSVEQVLAITASGSIGYAAYHAATREFPDRFITLRHNARVISRWNGPSH